MRLLGPHLTDAGMKHIASLTDLRGWDILGATGLGDAGTPRLANLMKRKPLHPVLGSKIMCPPNAPGL